MKDTEIHKHLVEPELRDFFSDCLADVLNGEIEIYKKSEDEPEQVLRSRLSTKQKSLRRKEVKLQQMQLEVELAKKELAVETLLAERGWQWFDVSENVENTSGRLFGRPFIGKEKEYDEFLNKLLKNEEVENETTNLAKG